MENFLSNFANTNATTNSTNGDIKVSPEFFGEFVISKGLLSMTINFYARVYKSIYENFISLDDWEINEKKNATFNGLPIDDIKKLINTMKDSGLSTIAEGLHIYDKEIEREIAIQIEQSKLFKSIFGNKARMLNALTDKEIEIVKVAHIIENYNNIALTDFVLKNYVYHDEDGNLTKPSLDKMQELYNELKN